MKKSTLSILMAAMLATSGVAFAQTAPAKPGTDGGSGPSAAETAAPGATPNTRADVKSDSRTPRGGTDGGSNPNANPGTMRSTTPMAKGSNMPGMENNDTSGKSRADVKAETAAGKGTLGIGGGSGASPADNPNTKNLSSNTTSAERKMKRDERRAMAKTKREGGVNNNASGSTSGNGSGGTTAPAR